MHVLYLLLALLPVWCFCLGSLVSEQARQEGHWGLHDPAPAGCVLRSAADSFGVCQHVSRL